MNEYEKTVRKRLIDKDMTLSKLAKELGISTAYIYDILKNSRRANHYRNLINKILEIQVDTEQ